MSERIDAEIKKTVCEGAGEPRGEVRARAMEGMAATRSGRAPLWFRWLPTALGAALVIAAFAFVPRSASSPTAGMQSAFAAQQAMAAEVLGEKPSEHIGRKPTRENLPEDMRSYAERAPEFVREHYPNDPQMLIAAGLLARDVNEALALLKAAVEKGGGSAAWAAYAQVVIEAGPHYDCVAASGADPADAEHVAQEERRIAESGVPTTLSPQEAAPVMQVLKQWQQAEPRNALPVAFEMYYLYGLHRDAEVLARWEEAARLPEVNAHGQQFINHTARLLEKMGVSPWQALSAVYNGGWMFAPMSTLRTCTRIAAYEGRLAQLQGRSDDAIRWWMATIQFGRHMQQSADILIECLRGIAIEVIGGSPVWAWWPDQMTGIPGGPLLGGRLFYGPQHDFFIAQAGEEVAEQIRDSLVHAKVRAMLARKYVERLGGLPEGQLRSMTMRGSSIWYGVLLGGFLLAFVAVSLWARKKADEATSLGWAWRVIIALLALAPVSAGFTLAWIALKARAMQPKLEVVVFGGIGLSFAAMLLLPLLAALRSRRQGARLVTAWRGNLRKVLSVAIVLCAALSLGLALAGRQAEARWARRWLSETEMARVIREIGPEWTHPKIPADAWRPQPPPTIKR